MKPYKVHLLCFLVCAIVTILQLTFPKGVSSGVLLSIPVVMAVFSGLSVKKHIFISLLITSLGFFGPYVPLNWEWLLMDKAMVMLQIVGIAYIATKFKSSTNKLMSLEEINENLRKRISRYQ